MLFTFITCFVIDLLSILKVIIISVIATDYRHPLRSCSIYQNATNCKMIHFRNPGGGGGGGGGGIPTAHAHVLIHDPLPVGQAACRVRR